MNHGLQIIPVPALRDNYIWLINHMDKAECVVVDPGEAAPVIQCLDKLRSTLKAILITHRHGDHTDGIEGLLPYFPKTPVVLAPAQDPVFHETQALYEGDQLSLLHGALKLTVYDIPGHTKGHIAYYSECLGGRPGLFCGDTLFSGGCGKWFEGTPTQLYGSLLRLRNFPNNTQIYCSHEYTMANLRFAHWLEPNHLIIRACLQEAQYMRIKDKPTLPSSLQKEQLINPFLKCDDTNFIKLMKNRFSIPNPNPSPLEIFTTIRNIKDKWHDSGSIF